MKVIVIGAGIAGLSTAAHLLANGMSDVTVVEARERYGGRVHTRTFGEGVVEMGGNWLHGTALTNSMFVLACQNELLSQAQPPVNFKWNDRFCYLPDATALDQSVCNRAYALFSTIRDEMDGAEHDDRFPAELDSVGRYLSLRVDEELAKVEDERLRRQLKSVINTYTNFERMSTACDLHDASAKYYGCFGYIPGSSRLYVPGGMTNLVDCIARGVPADRIVYETEVRKIAYDVGKPTNAVELSCRRRRRPPNGERRPAAAAVGGNGGGEEYEDALLVADCVVVTVPLGCLKASLDGGGGGGEGCCQFEPALPPAKMAAIGRVGYTGVEKLFVYYRRPFWERGSGGPLLCWPDERYQRRAADEWYVGMIGFSEYPYNRGVLFAWVPLPDAERLRALDDAAVKRDCARLFRTFLGNPSIPEPDAVCRSSWCDDPHSRGTYSYMSRRCSPADVRSIAEPILGAGGDGGGGRRPVVLFAGEATALPHYSTMHGARESGLREAERILAAAAAPSSGAAADGRRSKL